MPLPDRSKSDNSRSDLFEYELADVEFKRDQLLGGRYRVLSLLGRGGMGIVYRVEQIFLGKELALKTIEKRTMTDIIVRRFRAEAKAAFAVDHPNIVAVHDFGVLDEQTPFLVMEIIEGVTLGDRIKRGALPLEEALPIFVQVCFGLAHAHSCGVVHRDIKPNNIMLIAEKLEGIEGGVKILDFGIAKIALSDDGEIQALTRTGEIFGSPLYMSPEQCIGAKVDHRADIYSLGCVMFEALTGSPPFIGENALSTMMLHQTAKTPTLKEVSLGGKFPQELENLLQSMMAKDPNQRLQKLGEAALILGAVNRGSQSEISTVKVSRPVKEKPVGPTVTIAKDVFAYLHIGTALLSILACSTLMLVTNEPVKAPAILTVSPKDQPQRDNQEKGPAVKLPLAMGAHYVKLPPLTDNYTMRPFDGNKTLRSLEVRDGTVDDDGLRHLRDTKLLWLSMHHCDIRTVDNLCKLSFLQTVDLTATKITDDSLAQLTRSLKQLQFLAIAECDGITEEGLLALPNSNSLATLQIAENQFSAKAIKSLQDRMPQLAILLPDYKRLESRLIDYDKNCKLDKLEGTKKRLQIALKSGPLNYEVGTSYLRMGILYAQKKKFADAESMFKKADDIFARSGDTRRRVDTLTSLTGFARYRGDLKQAKALSQLSVQSFIDTMPDNAPHLFDGFQSLIAIPNELKDFATVTKISEAAIEILNQPATALDLKAKWLPNFYYFETYGDRAQGKHEEARASGLRYYNFAAQSKEENPKEFCRAQIAFANTLISPIDYDQRKKLYTEAIAAIEKLGYPDDLSMRDHYCDACQNMAMLYAAEKKTQEAVAFFKKALHLLKTTKHADTPARIALYNKQLREIESVKTETVQPSTIKSSEVNTPEERSSESKFPEVRIPGSRSTEVKSP